MTFWLVILVNPFLANSPLEGEAINQGGLDRLMGLVLLTDVILLVMYATSVLGS